MKRTVIYALCGIALAAAAVMGCGKAKTSIEADPSQSDKPQGGPGDIMLVAMGTGSITGVYYPTGSFIAKMIEAKKDTYNISCSVEVTGGSVFNVNAIINNDLEFGVVQSDIQYQAWHGQGPWKNAGPRKSLRSMFSIHYELVTLVAIDGSGIHTVADLKGKRVNIGNFTSGNRKNAIDTLAAAGLNYETDIRAENLKAGEAAALLHDGKIDAFFYTVGHPAGSIKEATQKPVHFVPITDIEKMLEKFPYYVTSTIPMQHYPKATNKGPVKTFGVKATLLTRESVDERVVYAMCKEVFDNLESFKKLHPAYADLTAADMLKGQTAPLHAGARKYFLEAGLITE